MKNFKDYTSEKYSGEGYEKVEEGIYKTKNPYGIGKDTYYVTSLSFEQEPEMYGEEYYRIVIGE